MPDLHSAAQGLRGQMGLAPDVNIPDASSARVITDPTLPPETPAQQNANAAAVLSQINAPAAPVQEAGSAQKDKAIADQQERIQNLQNAVNSQTEKLTQFMDALSSAKENKTQPEVNLPSIPADIQERPAEEQVSILTNAYNELQSTVKDTFKQEREQLKAFLGPFAYEVQQMSKIKDKNLVAEAFPNYDWDANLEAYEAKRRVMPGLSAIEAARLVADPAQLVEAEPAVPSSEATLPSIEAASGRVPSSQPQVDAGALIQRYNTAITDAHRRGNSVQAKQLIDGSLKQRLFGPRP